MEVVLVCLHLTKRYTLNTMGCHVQILLSIDPHANCTSWCQEFLGSYRVQACVTLLSAWLKCHMCWCFASKQRPPYLTKGNSRHMITTWTPHNFSVLSYPWTGSVSTYKLQCVTNRNKQDLWHTATAKSAKLPNVHPSGVAISH